MRCINLKENNATVDYALAVLEIEIESAKKSGEIALKLLHGYGSHGRGGAILVAIRKQLGIWKKSGYIKDFFGGDCWNLFDKKAMNILELDKTIFNDEDINKSNPGITIIQVN